MPPKSTSSILRQSRQITEIDEVCNVRPSKKGEVLLMKKLGIVPPCAPNTKESQEAYAELFDHPLSEPHLATIRVLFPAAETLSDEELATAIIQASEQVMAC